MKRTPSDPPRRAINPVSQNLKSVQTPAITSAGTVNMIPAASDSPVEAIVCTILFSRIEPERMTPRRMAIEMTAAGMLAETVIPTYSPR